jgi:hypothetical protein
MTLVLYCDQAPTRTEWSNCELNSKDKTQNSYDEQTGIVRFVRYKNVASLGPIDIKLKPNVKEEMDKYLKTFRSFYNRIYGTKKTKFVLYDVRPAKKEILQFNSNYFSQFVKALLLKLTEKQLTINSLRKIYETNFINSDEYKTMTNSQKEAKHNELLHRTISAQMDYYKVPEAEITEL